VQVAGDINELLRTHHRLTGPRREPVNLEDLVLAYMERAARDDAGQDDAVHGLTTPEAQR
jgi:hypothetical protein